MTARTTKEATLVEIRPDGGQVYRYGFDVTDVETLLGIDRAQGVNVGDRGVLVYYGTASRGGWRFERHPERPADGVKSPGPSRADVEALVAEREAVADAGAPIVGRRALEAGGLVHHAALHATRIRLALVPTLPNQVARGKSRAETERERAERIETALYHAGQCLIALDMIADAGEWKSAKPRGTS